MKGIDVSSYQANINWPEVKASGIDFAIIRAGWGKTNIDASFKKHIEGAINAGLKVGVYWFIYAKSEADVKKNASKCHAVINDYKDKISLRVWADFEYDSDKYFPGLDKATRTKWVKLFCQQMQAEGYSVGVYSNKDYLKNYFEDLSDYPLWYAFYASKKDGQACEIWQSSSKGSVPGIAGAVDVDTYYGTQEEKNSSADAEKKEPEKKDPEKTDLVHIVKKGETLTSIARAYGVTVAEIATANKIKNVNKINAGQRLAIPQKQAQRYKVNAYILNVRAGATINAKIIKTLKRGEIIEVEKIEGNWAKLRAQNAYVYKSYITKI